MSHEYKRITIPRCKKCTQPMIKLARSQLHSMHIELKEKIGEGSFGAVFNTDQSNMVCKISRIEKEGLACDRLKCKKEVGFVYVNDVVKLEDKKGPFWLILQERLEPIDRNDFLFLDLDIKEKISRYCEELSTIEVRVLDWLRALAVRSKIEFTPKDYDQKDLLWLLQDLISDMSKEQKDDIFQWVAWSVRHYFNCRAESHFLDIYKAIINLQRYGIDHADVARRNLMITKGEEVKLIDYGLVVLREEEKCEC